MFSALLKKLRSEKNLTQGQLAKEVGVSPGNVGDWETGKSKPGYNALASLARIFEVVPPTTYSKLNRPPQKRATTSSPIRIRRV